MNEAQQNILSKNEIFINIFMKERIKKILVIKGTFI